MTDQLRSQKTPTDELLCRELDSYRTVIRDAFDEGFAISKLDGPIETAWEHSDARQRDWEFAHTRMSIGHRLSLMQQLDAIIAIQLAALKETLAYWTSTGFAGCDPDCGCIVESVRKAIVKAEGRREPERV